MRKGSPQPYRKIHVEDCDTQFCPLCVSVNWQRREAEINWAAHNDKDPLMYDTGQAPQDL